MKRKINKKTNQRKYKYLEHTAQTQAQAIKHRHKHRRFTKLRGPQQWVTDNDNEKGTKLVTLYYLNSTNSTFTKEKLNTYYIHYTIAILESAKPLLLNKETKLLLLNKGKKSKELKSEKTKKKKRRRGQR